MDRRAFLVTLVAAYGCGQKEQPKKAMEAPARIPRIAVLYFSSTSFGGKALRQRLSELGYVEGKTIVIEERFADGDAQRLAELARELAASKVDIIVAVASAAAVAARQATSAIPIVMVHAGSADNLVSAGLIASLAQPGGNVTGTTNAPLLGKLVDLLRELVPKVTKIAILANPRNISHARRNR